MKLGIATTVRFWALLAEDHVAEFLAKALNLLRIRCRSKALGKIGLKAWCESYEEMSSHGQPGGAELAPPLPNAHRLTQCTGGASRSPSETVTPAGLYEQMASDEGVLLPGLGTTRTEPALIVPAPAVANLNALPAGIE
jgi:hypothetical protein